MVKDRAPQQLVGFIQITRIDNSFEAAAYSLLGAYLSRDVSALRSPPVLLAAAVVGLVVAFGFVLNDYHDVVVDSLNKPGRPIPSGRMSRRAAGMLALALALAALAVAWIIGPFLAVIALATIALSTAYSFWLKGTLLLGNVTMAVLDATIVLYGSLAAGVVTSAVVIVSVLGFLHIFTQEILYTVEDQQGDSLVGLRTTAVRLGKTAALRLFRTCALTFIMACTMPWLLGLAATRFLVAIMLCSILPAVVVVLLSLKTSDRAISQGLQIMKMMWFSSLIPAILLK